ALRGGVRGLGVAGARPRADAVPTTRRGGAARRLGAVRDRPASVLRGRAPVLHRLVTLRGTGRARADVRARRPLGVQGGRRGAVPRSRASRLRGVRRARLASARPGGLLMVAWPESVERVASFLRTTGAEARIEEFGTDTPTAE